MKVSLAVVAILLISTMVFVFPASVQADAAYYSSSISYPSTVGIGQVFNISIVSTANFENYTDIIYFSGTNLTGMQPTNTIYNYSLHGYRFVTQITAPSTPQTIYFYIYTYADFEGVQYNYTQTISVNIISPLYFHVDISNPTSKPIYNLTITYYLDSIPVMDKTISSIMPGQTVNVNYTYVDPYLSTGTHTLEITVNNPNILVDGKQASASTSFYYGTPPNYNWIYYIVGAVAVVMVIMALGAGRPRAPQPKWKRKKKQ
ncbi:MAG: CARDB domain-containing protein [Thermoplasmata archaeon]